MKEVTLDGAGGVREETTFAACVATILELPLAAVPVPSPGRDPTRDWGLSRWLGGMGLGLVPVADAASFSWAGPWLARLQPAGGGGPCWVVMFGVPSGVAWDPSGASGTPSGASGTPSGASGTKDWTITGGAVIAPGDVALALPPRPPLPATTGVVESIWIAAAASAPARRLDAVVALAGQGLDGDRHVAGTGTFPSGLPGSALTLIEAEVCESFDPPLAADEHRRNVVTRGIGLNALVGRDFTVGAVRCRGMRLCEPCRVIAGYAGRPILRALVHRGGLRADVVDGGTIHVDDEIAIAD